MLELEETFIMRPKSKNYLETSGAPVDELDGALGFDGGDGGVDILGHNVSAVQHAAGHVLSVAGVALDHLVGRLEAGVGDLGNRELLVVSLLGGDHRCVGDEGEVDTGVGHLNEYLRYSAKLEI